MPIGENLNDFKKSEEIGEKGENLIACIFNIMDYYTVKINPGKKIGGPDIIGYNNKNGEDITIESKHDVLSEKTENIAIETKTRKKDEKLGLYTEYKESGLVEPEQTMFWAHIFYDEGKQYIAIFKTQYLYEKIMKYNKINNKKEQDIGDNVQTISIYNKFKVKPIVLSKKARGYLIPKKIFKDWAFNQKHFCCGLILNSKNIFNFKNLNGIFTFEV